SYWFLHSGLIRIPWMKTPSLPLSNSLPLTSSLVLKRMTSISFQPSYKTPNSSSAHFLLFFSMIWFDMGNMLLQSFDHEDQIAFNSHYFKSSWVGEIVGDLFKKLAHEPFQKNHNLMKKYNLPSFSDLSYGKLPEDSTC
ncbi:hypothetical protein VP01_239g4, partial [Puccinia sorghi]